MRTPDELRELFTQETVEYFHNTRERRTVEALTRGGLAVASRETADGETYFLLHKPSGLLLPKRRDLSEGEALLVAYRITQRLALDVTKEELKAGGLIERMTELYDPLCADPTCVLDDDTPQEQALVNAAKTDIINVEGHVVEDAPFEPGSEEVAACAEGDGTSTTDVVESAPVEDATDEAPEEPGPAEDTDGTEVRHEEGRQLSPEAEQTVRDAQARIQTLRDEEITLIRTIAAACSAPFAELVNEVAGAITEADKALASFGKALSATAKKRVASLGGRIEKKKAQIESAQKQLAEMEESYRELVGAEDPDARRETCERYVSELRDLRTEVCSQFNELVSGGELKVISDLLPKIGGFEALFGNIDGVISRFEQIDGE